MPYWFDRKYMKLPRELNRKTKLTEKQIQEIRELKAKGWSIRALARRFGVDRNTIKYWTNEEFRRKMIEKLKRYRDENYTTEKHTEAIRKTRWWRRQVFGLKGKPKGVKNSQEKEQTT